jgi:hypothetical protein
MKAAGVAVGAMLALAVAACGSNPTSPRTASTATTTTDVTLPPSPPTTKEHHAWMHNFIPRQKGGVDVDQALALIQRLDPRVFRKKAYLPWKVTLCATDCGNPLELGETNPGVCYTSLEIDRIRRTAPMVGIPYRYWLAVVLVHEYQHCFTEYDERASVRAELAFEATWPNRTYRVRAERQSRDALTHIDAKGHWRD